MRWFRKCRLRFQSLFDRSRLEIDLEDELRDYIDHEIERGIAAGSSPEEARTLAVSTLHGAERLKEECRDARGVRWLEDSLSDLRFAVRTLRKAPAFTTTVIAALAFCIGVNTAIFSVVDTALFRPLPFPNQGRLVSVSEGVPSLGFPSYRFRLLTTCLSRPTTDPSPPQERTALSRTRSQAQGSRGVCTARA